VCACVQRIPLARSGCGRRHRSNKSAQCRIVAKYHSVVKCRMCPSGAHSQQSSIHTSQRRPTYIPTHKHTDGTDQQTDNCAAVTTEHQSARMSTITNDGTACFIAVECTRTATVGVNGLTWQPTLCVGEAEQTSGQFS